MKTYRTYTPTKKNGYRLVRANTGYVSAEITNLRAYCREHKLNYYKLYFTLTNGKDYNGYKLEFIES